ncbi:MAG: hypothetical protein HC883_00635 [Bdellovibrionaceae bacterium]|nr:hypothetical protein [Pseudobdellovibrionaceae bacterium]
MADNPTLNEIEAVIHHDPFEQPREPEPASPPAPASEATPPAASPTAVPPPEQANSPTQPAASALTPEQQAALIAELHKQRGMVEGLKATPPATTQPSAQPPATPEVELPDYAYTVPVEMLNALRSENPTEASMALATVARNVSRATHENVVKAMRRELGVVIPQLVENMVRSREMARQIEDDYFGQFPAHKNPALRPLLGQVAKAYAEETGNAAWSPQVVGEIGRRMNAILQSLVPPAPAPTPAPAPVMIQPGAASRAAPPSDPSREILETLGWR